jgi:hypothetical protein
MPDPDENDRKVLREQLKKHGPENVRIMLAMGKFPTSMELEILKWLSEQGVSAAKPEPDRVINETVKASTLWSPPDPGRHVFNPVVRAMINLIETDGRNALEDLSFGEMQKQFTVVAADGQKKVPSRDTLREARREALRFYYSNRFS